MVKRRRPPRTGSSKPSRARTSTQTGKRRSPVTKPASRGGSPSEGQSRSSAPAAQNNASRGGTPATGPGGATGTRPVAPTSQARSGGSTAVIDRATGHGRTGTAATKRMGRPAAADHRVLVRDQRTAVGWTIAVATFVIVAGALPDSTPDSVPVKAAALLVVGTAGLPFLIARALGRGLGPTPHRSEVWTARTAIAFVVVGFLSAMLAAKPSLAIFGTYDQYAGAVYLACLAGAWGLGTLLRNGSDRRLLEGALIAAALLNAVVAMGQTWIGLSSLGLPLYSGQPYGLQNNPVFLGALLAAALALVAPRLACRPLPWSVAVVVLGLGIGIAAERLPALLALGVAAWELWKGLTRRGRSQPVRFQPRGDPAKAFVAKAAATGGLLAGLTVLSIVIGSGLTFGQSGTTGAPGGGVLGHVASSTASETYQQRLGWWEAGLKAAAHRPLLGYGPDQFATAANPHYSLANGIKYSNIQFFDAHDLVIEYLVTTGLIGLGLLGAWLFLAGRRRRGPLAVFAVVILLSEVVEPQSVGLTPLVFLLFAASPLSEATVPAGAEASAKPARPEQHAPWSPAWLGGFGVAATVLAVLALVPAGFLIHGNAAMGQAAKNGNASPPNYTAALLAAKTATSNLPPWSVFPSAVAFYEAVTAASQPSKQADLRAAVHWGKVAVSREPQDPGNWARLAAYQMATGQIARGAASARKALGLTPWNPPANALVGILAASHHNHAVAKEHLDLVEKMRWGGAFASELLAGQCRPVLPGGDPRYPLALGCTKSLTPITFSF